MDDSLMEWHRNSCNRLLTELAVTLKLSRDDLIRTRHLIVEGIDIGLVDYGELDLGRITLFMDLGSFPESQNTAVYRQLLEQNLALPRTFGTFALNPDNGHAALLYSLEFSDELDGKHLASIIGELVEQYRTIEQSLAQQYDFSKNAISV